MVWFLLILLPAVLLVEVSSAGAAGGGAARLYAAGEDPGVVVLVSGSLRPALDNCSTAWMVQFYSSWCGHCIQYSPTWKSLAADVKDWQQVIGVAVLDCAQEENFDICKEYGVHFYPTFRYFRAHSGPSDLGTSYRGADRQVQTVRQVMVNFLQNHTQSERPDRCPDLEAWSSVKLLPLIGQRSDVYTAIIVEEPQSYVGREVILDLVPYVGVVVRRALSTDRPLVDKLDVTTFPSLHLLYPNGTHTHVAVEKRLRFFYASALRSLPGVHRGSSSTTPGQAGAALLQDTQPASDWRPFDSSKVYLADLESALHYLLRVEVATHTTLQGEELKTFKDFVTVVAKLYPVGGSVVTVMETVLEWLLSLPLDSVPYQGVLDLVNNKLRISGVFLGAELRWVGCQGSRAGLRGYPCSLWTLFHVLTVNHLDRPHALDNTGVGAGPGAVLGVMRAYIKAFFGCEECGRHFEDMAQSLGSEVMTPQQEVLWLWRKHNLVNNRLAGSLSEDPLFPKAPWPSASLCSSCHEEVQGVHVWSEEEVLLFLRSHYGVNNLSPKYSLSDSSSSVAPPPRPQQEEQPRPHDADADTRKEEEKKKKAEWKEEVKEEVKEESESEGGNRKQNSSRGGGGASSSSSGGFASFTNVDMSLCLLLYLASCIVIMLLFFFFRVRSRRRKTRHRSHHRLLPPDWDRI